MQVALMQDWVSLSTTTIWPPGGDYNLVQSEPNWLRVDGVQDAWFLVEVSFSQGTVPSLQIETAPAAEHVLFRPVQAALPLNGLGGSAAIINAFANVTTGPPLSRFVRWALTGTGMYDVCFRITMLAF